MTKTDITIPPEALEAAVNALEDYECDDTTSRRKAVRAACLAMLEAWPGSEYVYRQPHRRAVSYSKPAIILPLTENQNDKG